MKKSNEVAFDSSSFVVTSNTESRLDFVLNSLTMPLLREALSKICTKKGIKKIPSSNNLDDLMTHFNEIPSTNTDKLVSMYTSQIDFPNRHVFLINFSKNKLSSLLGTKKETKLKYLLQGKELQIRYIDDRYLDSHSLLSVLVDHEWNYDFWVEKAPVGSQKKRIKEYKEEIRRHSIVLRFDLNREVLLVSYDGFQGGGDKYLAGGVVYDSLTHTILNSLKDQFKLEVSFINLRAFIKQVIGSVTPKFSVEMVDSRYKKLELFMKKDEGSRSIVEEISDAIAVNLKSSYEDVYQAFNKVLKQSTVEETVLKWHSFGAKTVLRFLESGPELTFSWEKKKHNLMDQLSIAMVLAELSKATTSEDAITAWNEISEMDPGEVVTFQDLIQKIDEPAEKLKEVIFSAVEAGLLRPVYKLKAQTDLLDYENSWVDRPVALRQKFIDRNGNEIDGAELSNIIFGFQRVELRSIQ